MRRASNAELAGLVAILAAQAYLFSRPIHSATNYDEDVYLAATDALRHGQALGSEVFAAQFPGFYDLLRGLSFVTGLGVANLRFGLLAVTLAGTVGGWLVGRRFGGAAGGLLVAALLVVAPPLDLFGYQVIADTPCLALTLLSIGLATIAGPGAALAAGAVFGAALSVKLTALTALPTLAWLVRRRGAYTAGGLAIVVGLILVAHLHAVGDLWTSGVTYHDRARSTRAVIPHPHRQILDQISTHTPFFWLALAGAAATVTLAAARRPLRVAPLWAWVVLGVVSLLVYAPLHYNHLIVFPFTLAVAAGAALGGAVERAPRRSAIAAGVALAAVLVAAYVQQVHRVRDAEAAEPPANIAAARALERLTPPTALTVDDRPVISFLARRRVVGRLVDLAVLRWRTRTLTDRTVIRDLGPAYAVVVSRALQGRPAVLSYVRAHYALRYRAGGVRIYVRRAT